MSKLGTLIKNGRDGARLTQDELAVKLNVTQQTVSRWEAGKVMPPIERLPALASAIRIPVEDILSAGASSAIEMRHADLEPELTKMETFDARLSRIEELLEGLADSGPTKRRAAPLRAVKGTKPAQGQARRRQS